jgi:hypothetical protein
MVVQPSCKYGSVLPDEMAVRVTLIGAGLVHQAWWLRRRGNRADGWGWLLRKLCSGGCALRPESSACDAEEVKPRRDMTLWLNGWIYTCLGSPTLLSRPC